MKGAAMKTLAAGSFFLKKEKNIRIKQGSLKNKLPWIKEVSLKIEKE